MKDPELMAVRKESGAFSEKARHVGTGIFSRMLWK
jgi:hypothetical protein